LGSVSSILVHQQITIKMIQARLHFRRLDCGEFVVTDRTRQIDPTVSTTKAISAMSSRGPATVEKSAILPFP
jgi:hypothetical protein